MVFLSVWDSIKFLEGINFARSFLAKNESEALMYAEKLGFPVVMKLSSPDVSHKMRKGFVRLSVCKGSVVKVYREIIRKARGIRIDGIVVQETVSGFPMILSVKVDEQFGPVGMVGMGGSYVEETGDVKFFQVPTSKKRFLRSCKELRCYNSIKKFDLKSLAEMFSVLQEKFIKGNSYEIEINPVFLNASGSIAVDARVRI